MKFEPGKSGNPNGRPKIDPSVVARIKDLCPEAVTRLEAIVNDPTHKDHYRAVENVLNRVLGMPKQPIGLSDDDETTGAVAGSLAQVMALLDNINRRGQGCSDIPYGMEGNQTNEPDTA
jgi:hypothetical protein